MLACRRRLLWPALAALGLAGCVVPKGQFDAVRMQNQALLQQNRAQAAQVENLEVHARNTENQLARAEENLALMDDRLALNERQLTNYRRDRESVADSTGRMANWRSRGTAESGGRLAEIARRHPNLQFDAKSGVAKLDTDILFDSGADQLKPGAEKVLADLVQLLKSPDAKDLRLLVVGHTDDRQVAGRPLRERYADNFHLSAGRALAVADQLQKLGLPDDRLGVASFAQHQPVAPNQTPVDRRKNRRVEIFVMAPEVPVVGWIDTMPAMY
jgi:chemotaxis protein MotB